MFCFCWKIFWLVGEKQYTSTKPLQPFLQPKSNRLVVRQRPCLSTSEESFLFPSLKSEIYPDWRPKAFDRLKETVWMVVWERPSRWTSCFLSKCCMPKVLIRDYYWFHLRPFSVKSAIVSEVSPISADGCCDVEILTIVCHGLSGVSSHV